MFAVKQVDKRSNGARHHKFVSDLKMERDIISGLNHPHIVTYFGSEETETSLSMYVLCPLQIALLIHDRFMEYLPGASIGSCLRKYGRFNEELIKSFTTQIFDALVYLHASHIIHRVRHHYTRPSPLLIPIPLQNIEANNVLVDSGGICKLSGFGNAQRTDDKQASWLPMRGTVPWTAPEVTGCQGAKRYGPKIDVWSAGYLFLEMWNGSTRRNGDMVKVSYVSTRVLGVLIKNIHL